MKAIIPLLIFVALLILACDDSSTDLEAPKVRVVEVSPPLRPLHICGSEDDNSLRIRSNDSLLVHIRVTDNQSLSQLKVDAHHNFDCHGHGGQAPGFTPPSGTPQTTDWTVLQLLDLSSNVWEEELKFAFPSYVTAGNYHLSFRALDESGNESPFSEIYNVALQNMEDTIPPEISLLTHPDTNSKLVRGKEYVLRARIEDNRLLSLGGNGLIYLTYRHTSDEQWTTGEYIALLMDEKQHEFDLAFTLPNTLVRGEYEFALRGTDGVRNLAAPILMNYRVD